MKYSSKFTWECIHRFCPYQNSSISSTISGLNAAAVEAFILGGQNGSTFLTRSQSEAVKVIHAALAELKDTGKLVFGPQEVV